jgi:hypothetical protein
MLASVPFLGANFASFQPEKSDFNSQKEFWWKNDPNSPDFKIYIVGIARYLQQVPSSRKNSWYWLVLTYFRTDRAVHFLIIILVHWTRYQQYKNSNFWNLPINYPSFLVMHLLCIRFSNTHFIYFPGRF